MAAATSTVTFRDYRNAVDGQIQADFTLGQVEDFINACDLDEERKAALWLWAWLHQPEEVRRTFLDAEVLGAGGRVDELRWATWFRRRWGG